MGVAELFFYKVLALVIVAVLVIGTPLLEYFIGVVLGTTVSFVLEGLFEKWQKSRTIT